MHPSEALSPRDALGARATAFVIDAFLVAAAAGPLSGAGAELASVAVVLVLYMGVLPGVTGYTCGQALLGAKVVKAGTSDAAGAVPGLLRGLVGVVELPIFPIGAIAAGTDDRRRRLGDRVAGTEVIGTHPGARTAAVYGAAYAVILSVFVGLSSINTLLVLWTLLIPIAVAFAVVIAGTRRQAAATPWLVTAGVCLIPAAYLSFAGACAKGGGTCGDLGDARKAIPALIVLVLAIGAFFVLRGGAARAALAVGTILGGGYLVERLFATADMDIGAVILLVLLVFCVLSEVLGRAAAQRQARADAAYAATTG